MGGELLSLKEDRASRGSDQAEEQQGIGGGDRLAESCSAILDMDMSASHYKDIKDLLSSATRQKEGT